MLHLAHAALIDVGEFDHITGYPTRRRFLRDCSGLSPTIPKTVLLVTLAEAKQFNELLRALGHDCADEFVRAGAARLTAAFGGAQLYHVSVLSFALLLDGFPDDAAPPIVADVIGAFETPLVVASIPIRTRIGVGLATCRPGASAAEVLRAALTAAQDSRLRSEGFAHYDKRSDVAHQRAFHIVRDLETALSAPDQLQLMYQPRLDLGSGRCLGAEALLRWSHPTLGPISPGEFIPLIETTALISPLTDWVLGHAIAQGAAFVGCHRPFKVSANVSAANLREPGFASSVRRHLDRHALDPRHLEVEVTEGALTNGDATTKASIAALVEAGVSLAIDDFGTGYSSLSYLVDVPADVLKLDRSFLRDIACNIRTEHLVGAIVEMSHRLDLRVVAEGIEDESALIAAKRLNCDEAQGYHIGRPMSAAMLADQFH